MAGPRLLIVEDEKLLVEALVASLPKAWSVHAETDSRKALARLLSDEKFDVILLDLLIPELTGIALFEELRKRGSPHCHRTVFCTGARYIPGVEEFLKSAPDNLLVEKPYTVDEIMQAVREVMKNSK